MKVDASYTSRFNWARRHNDILYNINMYTRNNVINIFCFQLPHRTRRFHPARINRFPGHRINRMLAKIHRRA